MTKEIKLWKGKPLRESGKVAIVDECDYDRLNKHRWYLMEFYHCETDINYARRYERTADGKQKHIMMHREILGVVDTKDVCDHIDHNGLNNSRSNLRRCTHAENMSYRRQLKKFGKKYKGVNKDKKTGKWFFSFAHNGITYKQSGYDTEKSAAIDYNKKLKEIKGDFACLNVINE